MEIKDRLDVTINLCFAASISVLFFKIPINIISNWGQSPILCKETKKKFISIVWLGSSFFFFFLKFSKQIYLAKQGKVGRNKN
jgi:ABC-type antimicrobial peptide transport system permease subunit